MPVNNEEIQWNALSADTALGGGTEASTAPSAFSTENLTDVVSDPVALVTAAAADTGVAIYNLVDAVGEWSNFYDLPDTSTEDVLGMFAEQGYSDPAEYYAKHPIAVGIGSLLVGGGASFKIANVAMAKMMGKGSIMFDSTATEISALARARTAVKSNMEQTGLYSEGLKSAMKKFNVVGKGEIVADAVMQETVFAGLMSQHSFMEDYGWKDWMLGAGIYGGVSYATKALKFKLDNTLDLTQEFSERSNKIIMDVDRTIPPDLVDTPAHASLLQGKIAEAKAMAVDPENVPAMQQLAGKHAQALEARSLQAWDKHVDDSLKVKGDRKSVAFEDNSVLIKNLDTSARKLMEENPAAFVGVREIVPLSDSMKTGGVNYTFSMGIDPNDIARELRAAENVAKADNVAMNYARVAEQTGVHVSDVTKAHTYLTTQVFDTKRGVFMDLDDAAKRMGVGDGGSAVQFNAAIEGRHLIRSVPVSQVQRNLLDSATKGQSVSYARVPDASFNEMVKLPTEKRVEIFEYLNTSKAHDINFDLGDFIKAHEEATRRDIVRAVNSNKMDYDEVASRLNVTTQAVSDITLKGGLQEGTQLFEAVGKDAWTEFAQPRYVAMKGGLNHQDDMQKVIRMDDHELALRQAYDTSEHVSNSHSPVLADLHKFTTTGVGSTFMEQLHATNPATFSSRLFGDSTFALRHQAVSDTANLMGEYSAKVIDAARDVRSGKLADGMSAISRNDVERVSFGEGMNAIRNARPKAGQEVVVTSKDTLVIFDRETGEVVGNELFKFTKSSGEFWRSYMEMSEELLRAKNFNRGMTGQDKFISKGLVLPAQNLREGHRAYVIGGNQASDTTVLIHSPTKEGLESLITQARAKHLGATIIEPGVDAARFNRIHGHVEQGNMKFTEFGKSKTGTEYTSVASGLEQMGGFLADFQGEYARVHQQAWKNINSESTRVLGNLDDLHYGGIDEAKSGSVWNAISKTAFGGNEVLDNKNWNGINNVLTEGVQTAMEGLNRVRSTGRKVGASFDDIKASFEKEGLGSQMPWDNANDMIAQTVAYKNNTKYAQKAISTLNFGTATMALRFLEFAHPLVNTLSIPITTMPEISAAMKRAGHTNFNSMKFMMEGVRKMNSVGDEVMDARFARWDKIGITKPQVAEFTKSMQDITVDPSFVAKLDEKKWFQLATGTADYAEGLARRTAAGTADAMMDVMDSKASDVVRDAFVNTFVKRAMGNYSARQRPVMFQGAAGSAIGLFQTYMWTMAQNTYRYLEAGQRKEVMKLMAAQVGTFGLQSLPGYEASNHYIGSHYGNPENDDFTNSIFSQFGKKDIPTLSGLGESVGFGQDEASVAEISMYGLPSAMLQSALFTRGTISPRTPIGVTADGGVGMDLPAFAPIKTAFDMLSNVFTGMQEGTGLGDSLVSAFQQQQLSRPLSRYADWISGESIERTGKTVDPRAGMAWDLATIARATGARPLQEQVLRNLGWNNSYYNSQNSNNRRSTMTALRDAMQNDEGLTAERHTELFTRYMDRRGTVAGWRKAVNDAAMNVGTGKIVDMPKGSGLQAIQDIYNY